MPMNPEVKQLWEDALVSGEFEQGEGVLTDEDGKDCCLGVLCKLAVREGIIPEPVWDSGSMHEKPGYRYGPEGDEDENGFEQNSTTALPVKVMRWAGLDTPDPRVRTVRITNATLSYLNDDGSTFQEIRDFIHEQL